jgi:hypothetical protein
MKKVIVTINTETNYPLPFGKHYEAKGAYRQGKFIIVVGEIKSNTTVRVKYPAEDVHLEFV